TVVLDKTGTVTTGRMQLVDVAGAAESEAYGLAVSAERGSEHPIAAAIVAAADDEGGERAAATRRPLERFQNLEGLGVHATVDGHDVLVGRRTLLAERGVTLDEGLLAAADGAEEQGRTAV